MTPIADEDPEITVNSHEDAHEPRNMTQTGEDYDVLHALRGLAPGARITVHRQTPAFAKGFLDHITVPESGEIDIESEIKTSWGGGTFKLQPRQMAQNGRMNFGRGCVILTIAGEPTLNGRRYVGGVLEEPCANLPVAQPYMMPSTPQSDRSGLEGQLLTMVQQTLARAGSPNGTGVDLTGLGTLITSMSGILGGGGTNGGDAMGDMDRAFSLLTKMQKLSGMGATEQSSDKKDEDPADSFMGGGGFQQMLMMKLLGGEQTPKSPQYPPQYGQPQPNYPNQYPHTQNYHHPQQYPNPHRHPNWPAPSAGVPFQQPPHATPPPPPRPQASYTAPRDPSTMDGPNEAPAGGTDDGPFTVANLQAELEEMDESQRGEFMAELMQKLGMDEKMGEMLSSVVSAGPPNGGVRPPQSDAQPEVFPAQSFDPFNKDG